MIDPDGSVEDFLTLMTILNKINGIVVEGGNENLSSAACYDSDEKGLSIDLGSMGYYEYRLIICPDGTWKLHEHKPE